jgi:isoquinoline 1-oxidoreductase alpha subunit
VEGEAVRSCGVSVSSVEGKKITTIEGIGATRIGKVLQKAWIAEEVPQCGYCQPGFIMAAAALLAQKPKPTDEQIDGAITNLCRCGTYNRVRRAIHRAAGEMAKGGKR